MSAIPKIIIDAAEKLEVEFKLKRISPIGSYSSLGDIDFLSRESNLDQIECYLKSNNFVVNRTKTVFCAFTYIDGQLYFFDIINKYDHQLDRFGRRFVSTYPELVWNDQNLFRFIKYITNLRKGDKYINFVTTHYDYYRSTLVTDEVTNQPIFRETITRDKLIKFMRSDVRAIVAGLRFKPLVCFLSSYISIRLKKINSGKSLAFIGVDGVGKTTVIAALQQVTAGKVVYMGDYYFRLQQLYNWLSVRHVYIARLCFVIQWFEQLFRYFVVRMYTIRGVDVLIDRYPGFNRPLRKTGRLLVLNNLLYSFFPRPNAMVLLWGDPEQIFLRRSEMTIADIAVFQDNAKAILAGRKNTLIIENTILDETLNQTLDFFFTIKE